MKDMPPISAGLLKHLREAFPPLQLSEGTTLKEVHVQVGIEKVLSYLAVQDERQRSPTNVPEHAQTTRAGGRPRGTSARFASRGPSG